MWHGKVIQVAKTIARDGAEVHRVITDRDDLDPCRAFYLKIDSPVPSLGDTVEVHGSLVYWGVPSIQGHKHWDDFDPDKPL